MRPGRGVVEVAARAASSPSSTRCRSSALWGVGPATLERLERLGVRTVGDLAALDEAVLRRQRSATPTAGTCTAWPAALDDRPVEPDRAAKSIGHEETFATDRSRRDELASSSCAWPTAWPPGCGAHGLAARTVTVKVRFGDFRTITRSATLASADRHGSRPAGRAAPGCSTTSTRRPGSACSA